MQIPLLTKAELDRVLAPTSPHSFKHNATLLCAATGVPTSSEPITKLADVNSIVRSMSRILELAAAVCRDLKNTVDGSVPESTLTGLATCLGGIAIETRTTAAILGIPLEEVQEAMIGTLLVSLDGSSARESAGDLGVAAVNTVIYGVKRSRHPYENIQDE